MSRRNTAIWVSLSGCLWLAAAISAALVPDLVREYVAVHQLTLAGAVFTGLAGVIGHYGGNRGTPANLEAFAEVISRLTERALMQPVPDTRPVQRHPEFGIRLQIPRPRLGQAVAFSLTALALGGGVLLATRAESSAIDRLAIGPAPTASQMDVPRAHLRTSDWMPVEDDSASTTAGGRSGYPPTRLASRSIQTTQQRTVPVKIRQSSCDCRNHEGKTRQSCVIQVALPGAERELAGGLTCL